MRKFAFYMIVLLMSLYSCEKEDINQDKVVTSIIEFANDGNYKTVDFWIDGQLKGLDKPYEFKEPFILIDGNYYNLNKVIYYGSDNNSLQLHF